jgi:uncharacterized protein (TIGR03083 family)
MSKESFRQAAQFFASTVEKISPRQWNEAALGVWTVRDLVGHTCASFARVAEFSQQRANRIDIESAAQHYHVSLSAEGVDDAIAERGRLAGNGLGDDAITTTRTGIEAALAALETTPENAIIEYPNGGIKLEHYLETRVLELMVHTMDIQTAIGIEMDPPRQALSCTLHLLADLAVDSRFGGQLALLATGRRVVPQGFSVLG